jgi:SAM-dependent methyltransferase
LPIGPTIRKLFGRHEPAVAALYRSIYIDLDAYLRQIRAWVPAPRRILEVGAGEGAVTARLARAYPDAEILAIDITASVGRLYAGPRGKVTFAQTTVQQVARDQAGQFDFVILSDVLHHVPPEMREDIIAALRGCLVADGKLVFKDWARTRTPIHWMCLGSDRYLTGDEVSFLSPQEAECLIASHFGPAAIAGRATIAPWRNNFALLVHG